MRAAVLRRSLRSCYFSVCALLLRRFVECAHALCFAPVRSSAGSCLTPAAAAHTVRRVSCGAHALLTLLAGYLLADAFSKEGVLIDPVLEMLDRDLAVIKDLDIQLLYGVNTHCHADHVTGTGELKKRVQGLKSAIAAASGADADVKFAHGDVLMFGKFRLEVRATPGHTNGCCSLLLPGCAVFTGDAVLIRGCGRTDFQQGNSGQLYDNVHAQVFSLPEETRIYPGHDYKGYTMSTVGEEKKLNPRLTKSKEDFIAFMGGLNLPYPKRIDVALPANLKCGVQDDAPAAA